MVRAFLRARGRDAVLLIVLIREGRRLLGTASAARLLKLVRAERGGRPRYLAGWGRGERWVVNDTTTGRRLGLPNDRRPHGLLWIVETVHVSFGEVGVFSFEGQVRCDVLVFASWGPCKSALAWSCGTKGSQDRRPKLRRGYAELVLSDDGVRYGWFLFCK